MTNNLLFCSLILLFASYACGNKSTTKTENGEYTEWNVTVNKVVEFNDSVISIDNDFNYTVSDTVRVNALLKDIPHSENVTISWTTPSADGTIWLVAYENEPILYDKISITKTNSMPSYDENIQVCFKFTEADKWASITKDNIGKRLAILVNGKLINAPQVNAEIKSGNCSVSIPVEMIHDYLQNF